jgi:hypothetical protein
MDWSNKRVKFLPYTPLHKPCLGGLKNPSTTKILITSTDFHIPHLHLGIFAIYYKNSLHISDYILETSQKHCTISALLHALQCVPMDNNIISIFYMDKQFSSYVTNIYNTHLLDLTTTLITCFTDLLTNSSLTFPGFWFSKTWAGARAQEWHHQRKGEATRKTIHYPPPPHYHHLEITSSSNGDKTLPIFNDLTPDGTMLSSSTNQPTCSTLSSLESYRANPARFSWPLSN